MKIQYVSDLHLEFPGNRKYIKDNPITPVGDVLIMAGDILLLKNIDKHKDFLDYVSDHFRMVYWIPGNHEYYYYDVSQKKGAFKEKVRENVFLINNYCIEEESVRIILSTMWTRIRPQYEWQIERGMSDFHVIRHGDRKMTAFNYNALYEENIHFIKSQLEKETKLKTVVVTHHVPTLMHYPKQYLGTPLNDGFAVELFDLIKATNPDYWVYGHHHQNTPEFKIGSTKLLTNQLGYIQHGENYGFDDSRCIHFLSS